MKNLYLLAAMMIALSSQTLSQIQLKQHTVNETTLTGNYQTSKIMSLQPDISFNESPVNHNMHITSDGEYYYTINGGSANSGQVNKFDLNGNLLQTFPITLDGRGLSYNPADSFLYVSTYMGDIVKITNLNAGTFTTVFSGIMQDNQASFALSTDGSKFYDFFAGTLYVRDMTTGGILNTIVGLSSGTGNYGGEAAVAVDSTHIYTWNATNQTVYKYDLSGSFIQTMVLDSGNNGISLSVANGYLFVSKDGNYNIGTWYGYHLGGTTNVAEHDKNFEATLFPNPTAGKLMMNSTALISEIEIFDAKGAKVHSIKPNAFSSAIDLTKQTAGFYLYKITDIAGNTGTGKLIIRKE